MIIKVFEALGQLYHPKIFPQNTFLFRLAESCNLEVIYDEYQTNIKACDSGDESDEIFRTDDIEKFRKQYIPGRISSVILFTKVITYSAINIFKYLILNGVTFPKNQDYGKLAVRQGNLEIIKLLEQYGMTFHNCLKKALYCRQNRLIDWLIENYNQTKIVISKTTNIKGLAFCLENGIIAGFKNVYSSLYELKDKDFLKYVTKFKVPDISLYRTPYFDPIIMTLEKNDIEFFDIFYENKFKLKSAPPEEVLPNIKGPVAIKLLEMCDSTYTFYKEFFSVLILSLIENQDVETLQAIVDKNLLNTDFNELDRITMNFRYRVFSKVFSKNNQELFDVIFDNYVAFSPCVLYEFLGPNFDDFRIVDKNSVEMIKKAINKYHISYRSSIGFLLLRNAVLSNDFDYLKELINKKAPLSLIKAQQPSLLERYSVWNVPCIYDVAISPVIYLDENFTSFHVLTEININPISVDIIKYLYERGITVDLNAEQLYQLLETNDV
ncbi:hypothetical protein TVAG_463850 [Trichomonas vaginalis G3]|uniref:DUF3447 domain-containing protein n=1 Tax=Trichomonas vaginalis (strain ATCC PRA-98 / G3) TaxID=412133 RepID=A2E237_TRIV3|nr:protein ubiquitination [Trichomonas vaginalis G3]EAY13251.1 hypothetical protein TVAG_463850 [Trichomonas vaginalis G3]KAI5494090.1 protein ubiquitination [Trichomonas vaginalis G3]|eukprot:XP_001325474.1 hypothetical protein [Trichomonas vaginalis G3]